MPGPVAPGVPGEAPGVLPAVMPASAGRPASDLGTPTDAAEPDEGVETSDAEEDVDAAELGSGPDLASDDHGAPVTSSDASDASDALDYSRSGLVICMDDLCELCETSNRRVRVRAKPDVISVAETTLECCFKCTAKVCIDLSSDMALGDGPRALALLRPSKRQRVSSSSASADRATLGVDPNDTGSHPKMCRRCEFRYALVCMVASDGETSFECSTCAAISFLEIEQEFRTCAWLCCVHNG